MNVELPITGCNILNSDNTVSNYNTNDTVRENYTIYGGRLFLSSRQTSQYGYTHTGTCLSTGDLVYRPELAVYFPLLSMVLFGFTLWLVWRTIIRSLLP